MGKKIATLVALLYLAGCATSRTVKETTALNGNFSNYHTVGVELVQNPAIEPKYHAEMLSRYLTKMLKKSNLFQSVYSGDSAHDANLLVKVKIDKVDAPNAAKAMFMSSFSNSTVDATCSFVDNQDNRLLASVEAMGNSKNMGRSSIGGIGITSGNSYTMRAYQNVAQGIVEYIKKHH